MQDRVKQVSQIIGSNNYNRLNELLVIPEVELKRIIPVTENPRISFN